MKFLTKSLITIAFLGTLLSANSAFADRLDDIEKRGEIKIAVFDSNPPFGFIDETTNKIVGLDIDYANRSEERHVGKECRTRWSP